MSLPPLSETLKSDESRDSPLAQSLATLFEPSEILYNRVVPALVPNLSSYKSYKDLIDASTTQISQLPLADQTDFIGGHPRIGEVSGLSALSAAEQASKATPPAVLKRLKHLNLLYEKKYPGLVYITFVAGRSRAQIIPEMESVLGIDGAEEGKEDEPAVETIRSVEVGGEEWKGELDRAVVDVGRIAKSRLEKMGVE
ncbi:glucose-6-phosphate isomerase [Ceratobasidium sp. AG-Ba]|nr:glucose-6-phosphate isomerase [Ceratobasidium sp. AG-Ba]QRW03089.1 glucose-6-phosphate isomerase [Ceratobasidium sp. AG-Ba]